MAIDSIANANISQPEGKAVQSIGGYSTCRLVCANAEATAATATELLNPFSYSTASASRWVRRGANSTRAYFYARMDATATFTTSPIVQIYGALPADDATADAAFLRPLTSSIPNDGTWKAVRLDNTSWTAAGVTLTLAAAATATQNIDGSFIYSAETSEIDLQDCWYFTALIQTAGNVSNPGSVPLTVWARLLA